jgi:cyanate permease
MIGVLRDSTGSFDIGWISLAIFSTAMIIFNIYFKRLVKL